MNLNIIKNEQLNGIEIYFETKPEQEVLNNLKGNGFRWHNVKKCWYNKLSDAVLNFIQTLSNQEIEAPAQETQETQTKPIFKSDFNFIFSGLKYKDKYYKGYYNFNITTLEIEFNHDGYGSLPTPQGARYEDDTDSQTDYFCKPSIVLNPACKDYLSILKGYLKQEEHRTKLATKKGYKTNTNQDQEEAKNNALKLALELYNNPSSYNQIKLERVNAKKEEEHQARLKQNKLDAKRMIEGKNYYYEEIKQINNFVIGISKSTYQIIDFSLNGMSKPQTEYNITIIDTITGEREQETYNTMEEIQERITNMK